MREGAIAKEFIWKGWKLGDKIGQGASGVVYYATDFANQAQPCAIKVVSIPKDKQEIKKRLDEGESTRSISAYYRSTAESLLQETNVMRQLRGCKNIVTIHDSELRQSADGIGWDVIIRMELLTPLSKYIKKNPDKFDSDMKIRMALDLCTALVECHKRDIVHRDIKPDNIFVSADGCFKLGDFGVARNLEKTTNNLTRIGTMNYIAPEVLRSNNYGKSVDAYSLGMVLYRYFNKGRLPFVTLRGDVTVTEEEKALQKRLNGEKIPPPCEAPKEMADVILRMLEFDRKYRFNTIAHAKAEFEKLCPPEKQKEVTAVLEETIVQPVDWLNSESGTAESSGCNTSGLVKKTLNGSVSSQIHYQENPSSGIAMIVFFVLFILLLLGIGIFALISYLINSSPLDFLFLSVGFMRGGELLAIFVPCLFIFPQNNDPQ